MAALRGLTRTEQGQRTMVHDTESLSNSTGDDHISTTYGGHNTHLEVVLLLEVGQGRVACEEFAVEAHGAGIERCGLRGRDLGRHLLRKLIGSVEELALLLHGPLAPQGEDRPSLNSLHS